MRLSTGIAGLDAQLGGGLPPGTVHLLLAEPMNAMELAAFHFAGAKPGPCKFVAARADDDAVLAGVKQVGGDADLVQVVPLARAVTSDAKRIVVDSLSEVAGEGDGAAVRVLQQVKKKVAAAGGLALLTVVPDLHSAKGLAQLKLAADGVFELGLERQGFGLYPYLKVVKMRGVPDSLRLLLFKETPTGLVVESTRRVF